MENRVFNKEIRTNPKVEMLFEENIEQFNKLAAEGKAPDLRNANLSSLDLRRVMFKGLDLSGCYFKNADLRGVDFSGCNLHGVSLKKAKISGCLFPDNVAMEEIMRSVEHGVRIRVSHAQADLHTGVMILQDLFKLLQEKRHD